MKQRFPVRFAPLVALALTTLHACGEINITDKDFTIEAIGAIRGSAYLDVNGDGTRTAIDAPLPGLHLQLLSASNGGVVQTVTTDPIGDFQFSGVPTGTFRIALDPATAPDTVVFVGLEDQSITLLADSTRLTTLRGSFPTYSLAEARELPPGIRIATQGFALNARRPEDANGVVHLRENGFYLRSVNVERAAIGIGDSVRFVGRTARDAGLPILEDVQPFRLIAQAVFVQPIDLMSGTAASGGGDGELDAGLVRIRDAMIEDTMTVGSSFVVTANDGSGPVDVVFRNFIFPNFSIDPDLTMLTEATGLLVPVQVGQGAVRWRMTPRIPGDVAVQAVPPMPPGQP